MENINDIPYTEMGRFVSDSTKNTSNLRMRYFDFIQYNCQSFNKLIEDSATPDEIKKWAACELTKKEAAAEEQLAKNEEHEKHFGKIAILLATFIGGTALGYLKPNLVSKVIKNVKPALLFAK